MPRRSRSKKGSQAEYRWLSSSPALRRRRNDEDREIDASRAGRARRWRRACAAAARRSRPTGTLEPDKFLYERGTENLDKKRWLVAREYFRQLIDSYPQSPYRADAKLGLGDTYLGEKSAESFVLAANEFREFLNFYPTHERAHYAQYKLAMTHFHQMRAPMRDQTETRDAIRELQAYVSRYSDKPLIGEAQREAARGEGPSRGLGRRASRSTTSASSGIRAPSAASCRS